MSHKLIDLSLVIFEAYIAIVFLILTSMVALFSRQTSV